MLKNLVCVIQLNELKNNTENRTREHSQLFSLANIVHRVNDPWPLKLLTSIRMSFGTAIVFSALVIVFAGCVEEKEEQMNVIFGIWFWTQLEDVGREGAQKKDRRGEKERD